MADTPGQTPPGQTPPVRHPPGTPPDTHQPRQTPSYGHCCGRHASDWNAFLLDVSKCLAWYTVLQEENEEWNREGSLGNFDENFQKKRTTPAPTMMVDPSKLLLHK